MIGPDDWNPIVRVGTRRVVEMKDSLARRTRSAALEINWSTTIQCAGNFERKQLLTDTFFANEQQSSGQAA